MIHHRDLISKQGSVVHPGDLQTNSSRLSKHRPSKKCRRTAKSNFRNPNQISFINYKLKPYQSKCGSNQIMIYKSENKKMYPKAQNYLTISQNHKLSIHQARVSKYLRNQTVDAKNKMNTFLNSSYKNHEEPYRKDYFTSPINSNKHSIINIEDEQVKFNKDNGISKKNRSISNKRSVTNSKLPSIQQGSSKNLIRNNCDISTKVYNNLNHQKRSSIAKSNPKPRTKHSEMRVREVHAKPINKVSNKFDIKERRVSTQNRLKNFEIKKGVRRVTLKPRDKISPQKHTIVSSKQSVSTLKSLPGKIDEKSEEHTTNRVSSKRQPTIPTDPVAPETIAAPVDPLVSMHPNSSHHSLADPDPVQSPESVKSLAKVEEPPIPRASVEEQKSSKSVVTDNSEINEGVIGEIAQEQEVEQVLNEATDEGDEGVDEQVQKTHVTVVGDIEGGDEDDSQEEQESEPEHSNHLQDYLLPDFEQDEHSESEGDREVLDSEGAEEEEDEQMDYGFDYADDKEEKQPDNNEQEAVSNKQSEKSLSASSKPKSHKSHMSIEHSDDQQNLNEEAKEHIRSPEYSEPEENEEFITEKPVNTVEDEEDIYDDEFEFQNLPANGNQELLKVQPSEEIELIQNNLEEHKQNDNESIKEDHENDKPSAYLQNLNV